VTEHSCDCELRRKGAEDPFSDNQDFMNQIGLGK
jgi:hypothetical protein